MAGTRSRSRHHPSQCRISACARLRATGRPARLDLVEPQQELAARQRGSRTRVERLDGAFSARPSGLRCDICSAACATTAASYRSSASADGHERACACCRATKSASASVAGQRPCATAARCCRPITRASASDSAPRPMARFLPVTGERNSNRHERDPRADSRSTKPRTSPSRNAISPETGRGVASIDSLGQRLRGQLRHWSAASFVSGG